MKHIDKSQAINTIDFEVDTQVRVLSIEERLALLEQHHKELQQIIEVLRRDVQDIRHFG